MKILWVVLTGAVVLAALIALASFTLPA